MEPQASAEETRFDLRNTSDSFTIVAGPDFTRADFAMALLDAGYDPTAPLDDHFTDWTVAEDGHGNEVWTLYK